LTNAKNATQTKTALTVSAYQEAASKMAMPVVTYRLMVNALKATCSFVKQGHSPLSNAPINVAHATRVFLNANTHQAGAHHLVHTLGRA
jgi:hypothetical protein